MGLSIGLLAVSVAVATTVLVFALPRIGTPGAMTLFLRFAAVSGVSAVGSSAMYIIYETGGGLLSLVMGDVAMVLAPSSMFVALHVLEGRPARGASFAAVGLALVVAVVSATVALPGSLAVKALALAVACGATAGTALRSTRPERGPVRLIAVVNTVFAAYCVARVMVGAVAGWDSAVFAAGFSFVPATVLGALAVLLVGVGVVRLRFGPRRVEQPERCPAGTAVVIGDWDLASAAYGPDRMRTLVAELRAAAREMTPDAVDVPRGVEVALADATAVLGERLRSVHGWEPEQTILLVDGAVTAAIRLPPSRRRGFRRRSVRS